MEISFGRKEVNGGTSSGLGMVFWTTSRPTGPAVPPLSCPVCFSRWLLYSLEGPIRSRKVLPVAAIFDPLYPL